MKETARCACSSERSWNHPRLRGLAAAGLALALGASGAFAADDGPAMRSADAAGYAWQPFAENSPLSFTPLWGERARGGEYAMLLKLPAGFKAGVHSHSADYHAISVQGRWVHTDPAGRPAQPLSQGSYVFQPGGVEHDDACVGPQDCILFVHQHGSYDALPAGKPGLRDAVQPTRMKEKPQ